jgi:OFA family oxalate/formate antiporter-like MFS transporter
MRKYGVLAAAVVMQLCLGGIYAWSVFVPVLNRDFGYSSAQTQLVFGLTVAILCVGSVFGGRLQDVLGPRIPACLSGVLIWSGYMVAGHLGDRFWGLILGVSVLCGLGVGFGYVTSIAAAAKWFPERRGLVTGIVLSGYGCAAMVLSALAEVLLAHGWPVLKVFRIVGAVYGPAVLLAALTLAVPPGGAASAQASVFRRSALVRDARFWRLAIGLGCATYPGLALIGSLKPIGTWHGFAAVTAAASVSALAVGNGAGRIIWGLLHDRMRGRNPVLLMMAAVLASVAAFAAGGMSAPVFLGAAFLLGFCYGGSLAVFPSEVAAVYGVNILGSVYPVVLVLHGAAAVVAAPLTGLGVDITGGYWPGILMAGGMAVIGLVVCSLLTERGR